MENARSTESTNKAHNIDVEAEVTKDANAYATSADISKIVSGGSPLLQPKQVLAIQRELGNQATLRIVNRQLKDTNHKTLDYFTGLKMVASQTDANTGTIQRDDKIDKLMTGRLAQLRAGNVALLKVASNHIKNFARDTEGQSIIPDAKGIDRIIAKARAKVATGKKTVINVGDDIKDILRGTVVYDNFDQLRAGYKKIFKNLSTYGLKVVKVSESYTQEGKIDTAKRKGTDVDTTGYGDAKMVFNLEIPKHVRKKHFEPMMFDLPDAVPVELQFQTKAGLAVKSGKLGDQVDPDGKWNYRIEPTDPDARWRFDASQFVSDIITKMSKKGVDISDSDHNLLTSLNKVSGLPPAHDIYDPVKKKALSDEDIANAEKYYPLVYELAFRYSGMTDAKAQGLNDDVKRILKRVKK